VRRAVDDYSMIEEGDRIAIGISGGKDSLALLYALAGLRRFYPKNLRLSHSLSIWDLKTLTSQKYQSFAIA
jgi:tRNA(Ile)-lysidine synthase TilS/MesJ